MHRLSIRSICVIAAVLVVDVATPAFSQTASSQPASPQPTSPQTASPQTTPDSKARCRQLIAFYDRYGASRGENSDGARNMTRIAAGIDCENGRTEEGIHAMEDLLVRKKFDVPPATGISQSP